jgi:hypothetical protein
VLMHPLKRNLITAYVNNMTVIYQYLNDYVVIIL